VDKRLLNSGIDPKVLAAIDDLGVHFMDMETDDIKPFVRGAFWAVKHFGSDEGKKRFMGVQQFLAEEILEMK